MIAECARARGVPTLSQIELFCQNSYFLFQIVQVFLITTLTSAASAAITQIIKDPLSARTLLSANLPKASNFYVSYFIVQGLAAAANRMVHVFDFFRHQILKKSSENPRFVMNKWKRLRRVHWGAHYPVYTNMAVIGESIPLPPSPRVSKSPLLTFRRHNLQHYCTYHARLRRRRSLLHIPGFSV